MILTAQMTNSRERFAAISKGKQPPPKQGSKMRVVPQLSEEQREEMENTFAVVLAELYRKEHGNV